jgi:hypothetical protein
MELCFAVHQISKPSAITEDVRNSVRGKAYVCKASACAPQDIGEMTAVWYCDFNVKELLILFVLIMKDGFYLIINILLLFNFDLLFIIRKDI